MTHSIRNTALLLPLLTLLAVAIRPAAASDSDADVADGPWISDVQWVDDEHLIGTRSQGLLFRPAHVVKTTAAEPGELEELGESETSLWSVCSLGDGAVLASDYRGGVHRFGQDPKPFEVDARWIRAMTATPDGGEVLAGTEDGKLIVLSVADAKETRRIDAHAAAIFDIAFSAAGDRVATAAGDGVIKVHSWPKLEPVAEMSVGSEAIWSVRFVADDSRLVSGGASRAIQLWDVAKSRSIVSIATAGNWITSLAALPDSDLIVGGCMDGSVIIVDHRTMHGVTTGEGPGSAIWSIALAPDGQRLAVATRKHGIALLDVAPWIEAGAAAAKVADAERPPKP